MTASITFSWVSVAPVLFILKAYSFEHFFLVLQLNDLNDFTFEIVKCKKIEKPEKPELLIRTARFLKHKQAGKNSSFVDLG